MDAVKIGQFLEALRKEKNFTTEQMASETGADIKEISDWEEGKYIPPVEVLQIISEKFGVTINEILAGERLNNNDYKEKSEENIKAALSKSAFSIKEKENYFNKKWLKEHRFEMILEIILLFAIDIIGVLYYHPLSFVCSFLCILWALVTYNRKRDYIEKHIYGEIYNNKK